MERTWAYWVLGSLLVSGCILEDNPDFMEEVTGAPGDEDVPGCDDPAVCTTFHIGPASGTCPHEVDGVPTDECDWDGDYALRIAAATLELDGGGGLIVMHDNSGETASYVGGLDVARKVTIRAADGLPPDAVRVFSQDTSGVFRLRGDGVHLQGFTIVTRANAEWAIAMREELEGETQEREASHSEGTETGGHLIENLVIAATPPENVGSNGIESVFQSVGPRTVIRHNHIWGYFEGWLDLRAAAGSVLSHNTVLYYQAFGGPALDATDVDGLEISNNVFASLTRPAEAFVEVNDSTSGLVVVGNVLEGFEQGLAGADLLDPDVTYGDDMPGLLQMESPHDPRPLNGSTQFASAMAVSEGTSLDGVDLASPLEAVVSGAYQMRSELAGPRRTVITVGPQMCGSAPCDVTQGVDNELQRAAWLAWPGSTVEVYPSGTPYAGPVVVSWPIDLRGKGDRPEEVVIARQPEDRVLLEDQTWDGKDVVVDFTREMGAPTVIEMLTIEAGPEEVGMYHEGSNGVELEGRHEISRVILRDSGVREETDLADAAVYVGDDVVVHDVLIHGGYETCVRFGPRAYGGTVPPTTAYVHHLTCRLTQAPQPEEEASLAAFEVAAVTGVVIANVALELVEPGPLFRAHGSRDDDGMAEDIPTDFEAHAILAKNYDELVDGFVDTEMGEGRYFLGLVDLPMGEPLFVSETDSMLSPGSVGIDGGVDLSMLEVGLSPGVSLNNEDRSMRMDPTDCGAYEQQREG